MVTQEQYGLFLTKKGGEKEIVRVGERERVKNQTKPSQNIGMIWFRWLF